MASVYVFGAYHEEDEAEYPSPQHFQDSDFDGAVIKRIEASHHIAAVTADKKVLLWGLNTHGQCGPDPVQRGEEEEKQEHQQQPVATASSSSGLPLVLTPRLLKCRFDVRRVACGDDFTILLSTKGHIFSMGNNTFGQLGLNDRSSRAAPSPITNWSTRNGNVQSARIRNVAAGRFHCMAIGEDGTLYSWGQGGKGQLGYKVPIRDPETGERQEPEGGDQLHPRAVSRVEPAEPGFRAKDLSLGPEFSLILSDSDQMYVCGNVEHNLLGQEEMGFQTESELAWSIIVVPQLVESVAKYRIRKIAAGDRFALAATKTGRVFAWGYGMDGQLGNVNRRNEKTPYLIRKFREHKIRYVAAGGTHAAAVDAENGQLYTWGGPGVGQKGLKTHDAQLVPVVVKSIGNRRVRDVVCGNTLTVALCDREIVPVVDDSILARTLKPDLSDLQAPSSSSSSGPETDSKAEALEASSQPPPVALSPTAIRVIAVVLLLALFLGWIFKQN